MFYFRSGITDHQLTGIDVWISFTNITEYDWPSFGSSTSTNRLFSRSVASFTQRAVAAQMIVFVHWAGVMSACQCGHRWRRGVLTVFES